MSNEQQKLMTSPTTIGELAEHNTQLRREIAQWRSHYQHKTKMWESARRMCTFWEGKFHAVKRENNSLRRKLWTSRQALLQAREDGLIVTLQGAGEGTEAELAATERTKEEKTR